MPAAEGVLAWVREAGGERVMAAVNFGAGTVPLEADGTLLVSSDPARAVDGPAPDALGPSEAVLVYCR